MRWLRFIFFCTMLGILTTTLVAWSIAAWLPQRNWRSIAVITRTIPGTRTTITMREYLTTGAVRRGWSLDRGITDQKQRPFLRPIDFTIAPVPLPGNALCGGPWGAAPRILANDDAASAEGCEHAVGWPLLAGWYSVSLSQWTYVVDGGISLAPKTAQYGEPYPAGLRALPLRPIWRGVIVNSAVYATAWGLLIAGVQCVRRFFRRRAGRCTRCNYNVADLAPNAPCPECGTTARPKKPTNRRTSSSA